MKTTAKHLISVISLIAALAIHPDHSYAEVTEVNVDTLTAEGNRHYMSRNYNLAVKCYAEVIRRGYASVDVYYNLGNANYKLGNNADAILFYEKALLLKPNDEDIKQNLALVNARIIDKIETIPDFFVKRWIRFFQGLLNPDGWATLSLVIFIIALSSFAFYAMSNRSSLKKAGFTLGVILMLFCLAGLLFMYKRMQQIAEHDSAIIMIPSVNARSSPDEQSTNVFVLHEGTKVALTDSVQRWKEIRIANGNKGWVPEEALEEI